MARCFDCSVAALEFMKGLVFTVRIDYPARLLRADDEHVAVLFTGTDYIVQGTPAAVEIEHHGKRKKLCWGEFPADSYRRPSIYTLQAATYWNREAVLTVQLTECASSWHVVRAPGWAIVNLIDAILKGLVPPHRATKVPPSTQS